MAQTTEHPQPRPAARPEDERPGPKTVEEALEKITHPEQPTPTQAEADELLDPELRRRRDERQQAQQQQHQPAQPGQPVRRDVQGEHGPGYQTR